MQVLEVSISEVFPRKEIHLGGMFTEHGRSETETHRSSDTSVSECMAECKSGIVTDKNTRATPQVER